jgi:hypothetical protein
MVEDESYYWTSSRYIHLNPVRARLVWCGVPSSGSFSGALSEAEDGLG